MREVDYWAIHDLLREVADYVEADIEDTEYEEFGVGPNSIHKPKPDHKEAIRLLSEVLEEDGSIGEVYLEKWEEDAELSDAGRHGRMEDNPLGK